jgi:anti-sigma B factor antagonist
MISIESDETTILVQLGGDIDLATAPEVRRALAEATSNGKRVTVNVEQVTFMDCTGLHAILSAAMSLPPDRPLTVAHPSAQLMRIMELVGMHDIPQIEIRTEHG